MWNDILGHSKKALTLQQSMVVAFRCKAYYTCLSKFTTNLSDSNSKYQMSNF